MNKKVGIWVRVSTDMQVKGESPKHHEERARMYAKIKEWDVVEVYSLLDVSGKSVKGHPETDRMMADIRSKKITGLVFSKLARLSRDLKQLGEFSEFFQANDADLISLDEALDTSTPAGRMLYNIIGTFAQWEREEISDRVAKSVPIRAKLGKSLGGEAPFGFKWVNKKLELDEKEAPIRKLIHELFVEEKRKRRVAKILTERGYRTRKGSAFTDTTIDRLLKDPVAKGMRRVNYTKSTGDGKKWELKPKEEWEFIKVPRIISDELWDSCNKILDEMSASRTKVRRKSVHLFSSVLKCECGGSMYLRSRSPKYVCQKCKNKIAPDDLEEIYQSQLKQFLFSEDEIKKHIKNEQFQIEDKLKLIDVLKTKIEKLKSRIQETFDLYHDGQIKKESFKDYHAPLEEELNQKEKELIETQGFVDAHQVQSISNEQVLTEAKDLHGYWSTFNKEQKKIIIETITESIIVGDKDIAINLSYIPTLTKNNTTDTPNQTILLPIIIQSIPDSKLVGLCNAPTWVRCIVATLRFTIEKPTYKDYPTELTTLGDHLRKVRLDKGMSQPEVAKTLEVTTDTVTNWELNRNVPTAKFAKRILEFMEYVPNEWRDAPFHKRLFYSRMITGKTQRQVASEIGLDLSTIQFAERSKRNTIHKTRRKIFDYCTHTFNCIGL